MIAAVAELLRCLHCGDGLRRKPLQGTPATLVCASGHGYDLARQGHVTLLPPRGGRVHGDTSDMVQARADVQSSGILAPITAVVAAAARELLTGAPDGAVLDVGAGTGHHLATVLTDAPDRFGIAIDVSPAAARRAAKAHPRAGSVVADARHDLPVRDGVVALVLVAFAPRAAADLRRILAPGGSLLVLTPTHDHLAELVTEFDLLQVGQDKQERLDELLCNDFEPTDHTIHQGRLTVSPSHASALVRMGPSAWHLPPGRLTDLVGDRTREVTWSVRASRYHRRDATLRPR